MMAKALFPGPQSRPPKTSRSLSAGNSGGGTAPHYGTDNWETGMLGERAGRSGGGAKMSDKKGPRPGITTNSGGPGTGGFAYDGSMKDFDPGGYERLTTSKSR
jgi:hypothetical protein